MPAVYEMMKELPGGDIMTEGFPGCASVQKVWMYGLVQGRTMPPYLDFLALGSVRLGHHDDVDDTHDDFWKMKTTSCRLWRRQQEQHHVIRSHYISSPIVTKINML
eukprot:3875823-Karenia_brevis.AAC.1